MMALGVQALSNNDLRLRARPYLKRLAEETGETATLEVPVDDTMLILDEVSGQALSSARRAMSAHAGQFMRHRRARRSSRLNSTAATACGPSSDVLHRQHHHRPCDRLERELGEIGNRGFAETVDELEDGFSGVLRPWFAVAWARCWVRCRSAVRRIACRRGVARSSVPRF